jgi:NADH:ubiquinone oxidoreductase subunit 3 (subunit A)
MIQFALNIHLNSYKSFNFFLYYKMNKETNNDGAQFSIQYLISCFLFIIFEIKQKHVLYIELTVNIYIYYAL